MDDKEEDKKRVLTPPAEWSEGFKPASAEPSDDDVDESTDWLEDDDFEVPPGNEGDNSDDMLAPGDAETDHVVSQNPESDAESGTLLTDHGAKPAVAARPPLIAWIMAVVGFVAAAAMAGLWLDSQSSSNTEISALKETIRSLQRAENLPPVQDEGLAANNERLQSEIAALELRVQALVDENEDLKEKAEARAAEMRAETEVESQAKQPVTAAPSKPANPSFEAPPQGSGSWFVNLESHRSKSTANEQARRLQDQLRPLTLSIANATVDGQNYYRVRAAGFASKQAAAQASDWISMRLNAGPYWIGKEAVAAISEVSSNQGQAFAGISSVPTSRAPKTPVRLKQLPMGNNWFVFVDTYDRADRADAVINELSESGLDAKVAVESRSGELFYRVQIVGIEDEGMGKSIVAQLNDGEFKNAKLRKTVN